MFRSILRKLRGVLGTGAIWAAGWSVAGTILQGVLALVGIARVPDLSVAPFMWGLMGFYGGSIFGVVLSFAEGRRTLGRLRVGRVMAWGAVAGLAVPVVYNLMRGDPGAISIGFIITSASITAPLSALSAGGMTAFAQGSNRMELGVGEGAPLVSGEDDFVELLDVSEI